MMKKIQLKRICAFLMSVMLTFCACAQSGENGGTAADHSDVQTESGAEETEKLYLDNLPEKSDYNGIEMRFLTALETISVELSEEDDTGEVVKGAYWRRNHALEERLNVDIVLAEQVGYDAFNSVAGQSITAGSDDYDILCGHTRFNVKLASEGSVLNLNDYGFGDYIDISQPYWSELYISNINYRDNLYWLAGDMTHSFISYIYAMFVNSTVWNNYYNGENINDIVLEGGWTLDTLHQYAEGTYTDNNGDTRRDAGDSYGVIMQQGNVLNGMIFAANVQYTGIDDSGEYYVALNNEHTVDVYSKLHTMFYETEYGLMLGNEAYITQCVKMFSEDRVLFCPRQFHFTEEDGIRSMESDFYIIPLPKYDAAQENYRVNQYDGVPIYGVPTTLPEERIPAVASTLEAMCSMTSQMVIPVYYDVALKDKYSRDETTAQMIDLIHDSITADFCFYWGDSVGGLMGFFYKNIQTKDIASKMRSSEKIWQRSLGSLLERLEEADA